MDRIEVRPAPIRRRGCTPANKPNSILIKAHRQKLLAAIAANPGATRSQLRREFAASSVRYLARHDLDWLVRVLPAPKKYDWPEKDRRLAEAVPAAARELLMGPAPARRVTATRIAQKISTDD
jgi:hypothetical protein